jgi:phosphate uptake regulator
MARNQSADDEPAIRKVQRTGGSTFTVSLPKDWARSQDLEAGSDVYVYDFEDRVVVAPTARTAGEHRQSVDADGLDAPEISRLVRAAYASGADKIAVEAADGLSPTQRRAAERALTGLVGVQVAAGPEAGVAGRSTLDDTAVSLTQTIAQLRQQVLGMLREAIEAVVEDDADLAAAARGRREAVDRLVALVARQFQGALVDVRAVDRLETDRASAYRQAHIARQLQDVATAAERIAATADAQSDAPAAGLQERLTACGEAAREAIATALDGEREAALAADEECRVALAALDDALAEHAGPDAHRYGRVLEACAGVADAAEGLATIRVSAGRTA